MKRYLINYHYQAHSGSTGCGSCYVSMKLSWWQLPSEAQLVDLQGELADRFDSDKLVITGFYRVAF